MSGAKTDILFTLGEDAGRTHGEWPDYLAYGFDDSDVAALLELVADQSLHAAAADGMEVWVPLHAWRCLGQLGAEAAVEPLISLFDTLVEDDWALSELPQVLGMIGACALEPLSDYFLAKGHDQFARVMALHAMCEIAQRHPNQRDKVLARYQSYLQQADSQLPALNGLLISYLVDLDARELIEDIRALFNRRCVDLGCAGDMEDVEIQLGFRSERSTPRPRLHDGLFDSIHDSLDDSARLRPDGDDDLELIEYYLFRYGSDESLLGISELDGYFAAIACAPHTIMPSVWIPGIWGGEAHSPGWETIGELQEFNQLIMKFYNYVMEGMNESWHEAMFLIGEVDGQSHTIVDDWCEGFLRGINLWGPISAGDASVVETALEPIRLFATEPGFVQLDTLSDAEIELRQQAIEPAVRQLFAHFYDHRKHPHQPVIRSEPKVGRNDPCICGSGKKYKKCCLH